ncbi:ROK family protein [Konateibacter massiliensis]|uniref:ROK family protein n=1 Tax=Konateibacter massiliensis TaxID=2002841 RepID=UPI000C150D5B|nr:ROK family protein [Konateibacter massiliensis]
MKKYAIGVDIGGTNIAAGFIDDDNQLVLKASVETPKNGSADEIIVCIASLIEKLAKRLGITRENYACIGMGVPGTVNKESGKIEFANNLSFHDEDLIEMLKKYYEEIPITMNNDANAAAYGEFVAGAGKEADSLIMVTLGTGIGGGIIIDRKLYEGSNFAAGELGHFVINCEGIPCNCGRKGCFEAYASATALIEQTKAAMKKEKESILWELCDYNLEKVEGKTLFDSVRLLDKTAEKVMNQYIYYLSVGIIDIINIFQPDMVCIGGGISKAGDLILDGLLKRVQKEDYARTSSRQTKIVFAQLENDAGIIGAGLLARDV